MHPNSLYWNTSNALGSGMKTIQGPFLTHLWILKRAGLINTCCANEQRQMILATDLLRNQCCLDPSPAMGTKGIGAQGTSL